MISKLLVLATLALSAAPAIAEDLSATISTCAGVSDDRARLSCYDGLAARAKAAVQMPAAKSALPPAAQPAPAPIATVTPPSAPVPPSPPATKTDTFGAESIRKPDTPEARAQEVDEIKAKVVAVDFSPTHRFTVTLDNGQIWRQIEADSGKARFLKGGGDSVEISRGMLGSYNLVIEGANMLFKVRRIR